MNIYIDFDDTIVNSVENVIRIANKRYNQSVQVSDVDKWDFSYLYPNATRDEIIGIFGEQEFFDTLHFKKNAILTLQKLSKRNFLFVVTKTIDIASGFRKYQWIQEHLNAMNIPVEYVAIFPRDDKSIVDMSDGIMIDDNANYLEITNAKYKILYDNQREIDVNMDWDGLRVYDWQDAYKLLSEIIGKEKGITNGKI